MPKRTKSRSKARGSSTSPRRKPRANASTRASAEVGKDEIHTRLRVALDVTSLNVDQVAEALHVDDDQRRKVRYWFQDGGPLPRATQIGPLAQVLDVTTDWLLGRVGRSDRPQRPGRERSESTLAVELAAYVRSAALTRLRTNYPTIREEHVGVKGDVILEWIASLAAERAERNFARARRNMTTLGWSNVVEDALLQFSVVGAVALAPDQQGQVARDYQTAWDALHALFMSSIEREEFEPGIGVGDSSGAAKDLWPVPQGIPGKAGWGEGDPAAYFAERDTIDAERDRADPAAAARRAEFFREFELDAATEHAEREAAHPKST